MKSLDASYRKKLKHFSKSIFKSCQNMNKNTKILALSWESKEDKDIIIEILHNLQKLDLITYSAGFSSIKITLTVYGKLRITKYDDWYE